jgi:hypothetical protein
MRYPPHSTDSREENGVTRYLRSQSADKRMGREGKI